MCSSGVSEPLVGRIHPWGQTEPQAPREGNRAAVPDALEACVRSVVDTSDEGAAVNTGALLHGHAALGQRGDPSAPASMAACAEVPCSGGSLCCWTAAVTGAWGQAGT